MNWILLLPVADFIVQMNSGFLRKFPYFNCIRNNDFVQFERTISVRSFNERLMGGKGQRERERENLNSTSFQAISWQKTRTRSLIVAFRKYCGFVPINQR